MGGLFQYLTIIGVYFYEKCSLAEDLSGLLLWRKIYYGLEWKLKNRIWFYFSNNFFFVHNLIHALYLYSMGDWMLKDDKIYSVFFYVCEFFIVFEISNSFH